MIFHSHELIFGKKFEWLRCKRKYRAVAAFLVVLFMCKIQRYIESIVLIQ